MFKLNYIFILALGVQDAPEDSNAPPAMIVINFGNETRYDWEWNNPLLVAEATFSVATVLTCMSILRNLMIFEFAGPLEV